MTRTIVKTGGVKRLARHTPAPRKTIPVESAHKVAASIVTRAARKTMPHNLSDSCKSLLHYALLMYASSYLVYYYY
jgi:hypothetical protein